MEQVRRFFDYARERENVRLRRLHGATTPYTTWPILQKYRFCNIFREDDRTTAWFRTNVRDPLASSPEALLATVVFRMFNRIASGEAMFTQTTMDDPGHEPLSYPTAFELFVTSGDVSLLRQALVSHLGEDGPFVTGSYIIAGPGGMSKLDGMLKVVGDFWRDSDWRDSAFVWQVTQPPLEAAHRWLSQFPFFGDFHSYEIVTDLRHTSLLRDAPDTMTWCNPGPGARRGMRRVLGIHHECQDYDRTLMDNIREILRLANSDATLWPAEWPRWEMREVEHTLCEFDKFERTRMGQGRPRGVFAS